MDDAGERAAMLALAHEWLDYDQNDATRDDIQRLVDADDIAALQHRLSPRIGFGTAGQGLRARLGAGYAFINDLVVIQTAQALCAYLLETVPDAARRGVVVGHDHRHGSADFAALTVAVFISQRVRVHLLRGLVHTPLVPFSILRTGAGCGVMVTASHNPASYNGYKVYWENGCQIVRPHDAGISAQIRRNQKPWQQYSKAIPNDPLITEIQDEMLVLYTSQVQQFHRYLSHDELARYICWLSSKHRFLFTAMHGVGQKFLLAALNAMAPPIVEGFDFVEEQVSPDPNFPTTPYPNPEEAGALDLAIQSKLTDHQIILATDPDADRFSAAIGTYTLSGNQLGILFADFILQRYRRKHGGRLCMFFPDRAIDPNAETAQLAMLTTTVSTRMLKAMAEKEGFHYVETLTGFKWLGNKIQDLRGEGYDVQFAFEEAIGFCFPEVLEDKDGVISAVVFVLMVAGLALEGRHGTEAIQKRLDELHQMYGYYFQLNHYIKCSNPQIVKKLFDYLRNLDKDSPYPLTIGNLTVKYWRDLTQGFDSSTDDHIPRLPQSKLSQMITIEFDNGAVTTFRNSGTEPKIKYYIEGKGNNMLEAEMCARYCLKELMEAWIVPSGLLHCPLP